jgi:hypothetical protein
MKRLALCSFLFVACALTDAAADSITLVFDEIATCTPFVKPSASTCKLSEIEPVGTILLKDGIANQFYNVFPRLGNFASLLGVRYTINTTVPMFNWGLSVDTLTHLSNFYIVDGVPNNAGSGADEVENHAEYLQFSLAQALGLFNGHLGVTGGFWEHSAQIDVFRAGAAPLTLADVLAPNIAVPPIDDLLYSGDPLLELPFGATSGLDVPGPNEVFYGATVPEPPSGLLLVTGLGIVVCLRNRFRRSSSKR